MKLLFATFLSLLFLTLSAADTPVTCLYSEECVMPCRSSLHDIIHWYKGEKPVHSFFNNQDHLNYQAEEYKSRTELFLSQIKDGNTSLLLKMTRTQDEGRYRCYTANDKTSEEKFVDVSVVAPVKSVDITLKDNTVTCITSEVFPRPLVSWSSDPPGTHPETTYSETDENLVVVTSKLARKTNNGVTTYSCSIINPKDNRILYTASLKQQEISLRDEATFQCPFDGNIILTFKTSEILKYDSQTSKPQISDEWKNKVSFSPDNGAVRLHHLSSKQLGTYTCESFTAQTRYVTHTVITKPGVKAYIIALAVVIPLVFILLFAIFVFKRRNGFISDSRPTAKHNRVHLGFMYKKQDRRNTTNVT